MLFRTMAVALILFTAACSGSTKSKSAKTGGEDDTVTTKSLIDEDEEKEDKDVIARRQCLGENHKPKECLSDEDCCQGFYCGKDPEISPRVKVCIDSGG